jgi:hypothetical protein
MFETAPGTRVIVGCAVYAARRQYTSLERTLTGSLGPLLKYPYDYRNHCQLERMPMHSADALKAEHISHCRAPRWP